MFVFTLGTIGISICTEAIEINTPILQSPISGASITSSNVTLKWFFVDFTNYYQIQIALDEECTQVIVNKTDIDDTVNQFVYEELPHDGTRLYWRVRATERSDGYCSSLCSPCSCSEWSAAWSFISALPEVTPEPHPADINADWRLVMEEIIPYIGGWQQGTNPMAYAIRGVSLWQNGEYYAFNGELSCPLCWVLDSKNESQLKLLSADLHTVTRSITDKGISLAVTPAAGATVWGLEEYIPSGLTVMEIKGSNGTWDAVNRKISWWSTGDTPATSSYQVAGEDGSYAMQGAANIDGVDVAITGDDKVLLGNVSGEGEQSTEGENEEQAEGEYEVLVGNEGEVSTEGEEPILEEESNESAGCCSVATGKNFIEQHLGNWLLFAMTCLVLVRMGRMG